LGIYSSLEFLTPIWFHFPPSFLFFF
jgi:hypothetical protein